MGKRAVRRNKAKAKVSKAIVKKAPTSKINSKGDFKSFYDQNYKLLLLIPLSTSGGIAEPLELNILAYQDENVTIYHNYNVMESVNRVKFKQRCYKIAKASN